MYTFYFVKRTQNQQIEYYFATLVLLRNIYIYTLHKYIYICTYTYTIFNFESSKD